MGSIKSFVEINPQAVVNFTHEECFGSSCSACFPTGCIFRPDSVSVSCLKHLRRTLFTSAVTPCMFCGDCLFSDVYVHPSVQSN